MEVFADSLLIYRLTAKPAVTSRRLFATGEMLRFDSASTLSSFADEADDLGSLSIEARDESWYDADTVDGALYDFVIDF
jgi:hypothetical protein